MSKHVTLALHLSEETVVCDFSSVLVPIPTGSMLNPISDYFDTTSRLVKKIVDTKYANDAEILGLLVLGVVSSAEFYFRSIIAEIARTCPLCERQAEIVHIPFGSPAFYKDSAFALAMSAFEHESLADSKKIAGEIRRFAGFSIPDASSVKKALDDFERLCELRHCFVHARGHVGLKAMRALGEARAAHKILVGQQQALDLIKLSHNAVRAVNHYVSNEIVNRWIDNDVLSGQWAEDKALFTRYWRLFSKRNEDAYGGVPRKAYTQIRPIITKRRQGIAAKVGAA
ncbi:MAG: hypothetical protein U1F09_09565 [Steroidobacteraceae bacterium]